MKQPWCVVDLPSTTPWTVNFVTNLETATFETFFLNFFVGKTGKDVPLCSTLDHSIYSEVPNRRADRNKRAGLKKKFHPTLPAFLLSELINEQGGIFCLLHEKL